MKLVSGKGLTEFWIFVRPEAVGISNRTMECGRCIGKKAVHKSYAANTVRIVYSISVCSIHKLQRHKWIYICGPNIHPVISFWQRSGAQNTPYQLYLVSLMPWPKRPQGYQCEKTPVKKEFMDALIPTWMNHFCWCYHRDMPAAISHPRFEAYDFETIAKVFLPRAQRQEHAEWSSRNGSLVSSQLEQIDG